VGVAIQDGYIESIDDTVGYYVNALKNCPCGNITIKNLLQMSSGIAFDENYFSWLSDLNKMMAHVIIGFNIESYMCGLQMNHEQGKIHNYISINTQLLGTVLRYATGRSLTDYLEEKIWQRGGFECDLFWLINKSPLKTELAIGTINTCTRDYVRFGWLYLNQGKSPLDGQQLIRKDWITASITPNAPHLKPGLNPKFPLGYGYQWWIPGYEDDYVAIGIYNQFIYVSPKHKIVIAKNSAYAAYETNPELSELGTIAMFQQIVESLTFRNES
jgi:hypothetical protein